MSLVEAFWSDSTPFERRLLLDEVGGRSRGRAEFNFNVFDVALDFDERTVTVFDVLTEDESEMTTLDEFILRARSYGDDPSIGDGLTQMQRRPPGKDQGIMQRSHRDHLAAATTVAALTALVVATVLQPRLAQLRTATTSAGGATLVIVGVLISLAALTPLAALARVQTWKPVTVSIVALALGSVLVLSFNESDGSDGLFMLPLLIGSVIIVGMSGLVTLRLRRRAS